MCTSEALRARCAGLLAVALAALAACGGRAPAAAASAPVAAAANPAAAPTAPAAASIGPAAPDAAAAGTRLLDQPDDLQLVLLGYRLRGQVPPLQEWAQAQPAVTGADEFTRAAALKSEVERLQAIWNGTAGIGRLRFNVDAHFSEYDGTRGGYYLDAFTPGSYFDFTAKPAPSPVPEQRISLRVDNPEELNFWPLDAAAAQEALNRNGGMRDVVLDCQFRIIGVGQRSDAPEIAVHLLRYAIQSSRYRQQGAMLGERSFGD